MALNSTFNAENQTRNLISDVGWELCDPVNARISSCTQISSLFVCHVIIACDKSGLTDQQVNRPMDEENVKQYLDQPAMHKAHGQKVVNHKPFPVPPLDSITIAFHYTNIVQNV